jgi:cytochrome c oxidase assembly protein Cox11
MDFMPVYYFLASLSNPAVKLYKSVCDTVGICSTHGKKKRMYTNMETKKLEVNLGVDERVIEIKLQ